MERLGSALEGRMLLRRKNRGEMRMPEKDDAQRKQSEKKVEVDFGIGKIFFSSLFQGIGSLIDLVSKMEEEGKGEVKHEEAFTSPSGRVKAVYGFSVNTNLGGMPTVEPFGNVRKTARGPVVEEERQPFVDVFDEQDYVLVIIELPGVEEEHTHTEVNGDILILSTASGNRKYYKEVVLPKDVDASNIKSKYKNGILEIRMSKK
jgi:HSP20 family protein